MKKPLLSVIILAYNHEPYIKKCLDSVLIQKTNFDFEIVLGEDESTDGTRAICKAYAQNFPDKIRLFLRQRKDTIYLNNQPTGRFNFKESFRVCQGNYVSICEGDDYWTDPFKLQKQVDFLESNTDYSICWTKCKILNASILLEPEWTELLNNQTKRDITFENFSSPYCTYTLTCTFRKDCLKYRNINQLKYFKDNSIYMFCLQQGKGAVLNFYGGVYRKHDQGIYSLASDYQQAISNYSNYEEILTLIPESRVPNIIGKRNNWERQFLKTLYARRIPKLKKWYIRGRLLLYFKYLNVINS